MQFPRGTVRGTVKRTPSARRSTEQILAHLRFPVARNVFLEAMLAMYEHEPFLNRLLLEAGRNVLFIVLMCLHARSDEDDRDTWPTLGLVKASMAAFGLASPRRVADLVARLLKTGYLAQRLSPQDRRVRILTPTSRMIAQDQDWLVAHYVPLQVLFADPGYAPIMRRDRAFHLQYRAVAASLLPLAARIMKRNPLILRFMQREAGMMVLIKLLHLAGSRAHVTCEISYSDIGARFGVSRTQVRKVVQEAEESGLLQLSRRGAQFVRLKPKLLEAFDDFIADTMAGHDLVYNLAQRAGGEDRSESMQNVPLMGTAVSFKQGIALHTFNGRTAASRASRRQRRRPVRSATRRRGDS